MIWIKHKNGWTHSPAWKVAINTVLRALQCGRRYRWLIVTKADFDSILAGKPVVTGYGFSKVEFKDAP